VITRHLHKLIVVLLLLMIPMSLNAQDAPSPIIAYMNGQVFVGDGAGIQPFDACTPDEAVMMTIQLSPTANAFVLATQPASVTDALAELGTLGGLPIPTNLYLCDMATQTLTQIASQGDNYSFFSDDAPDAYTTRTSVAWSPDGTQFAWAEMSFPSIESVAFVYDLATGTTTSFSLVGLPEAVNTPAPPFLIWTDSGLVAFAGTLDDETFEFVEITLVYDAVSGELLSEYIIEQSGELDDFIQDRLYITDADGQGYLGVKWQQAGWVLVDVITGESRPMGGLPEQYETNNPTGLSLIYDMDANYQQNWVIGATGLGLFDYDSRRVALMSQANGFAYGSLGIEYWQDGQAFILPGSDGFSNDPLGNFVWAGVSWRVAVGAVPVEPVQ